MSPQTRTPLSPKNQINISTHSKKDIIEFKTRTVSAPSILDTQSSRSKRKIDEAFDETPTNPIAKRLITSESDQSTSTTTSTHQDHLSLSEFIPTPSVTIDPDQSPYFYYNEALTHFNETKDYILAREYAKAAIEHPRAKILQEEIDSSQDLSSFDDECENDSLLAEKLDLIEEATLLIAASYAEEGNSEAENDTLMNISFVPDTAAISFYQRALYHYQTTGNNALIRVYTAIALSHHELFFSQDELINVNLSRPTDIPLHIYDRLDLLDLSLVLLAEGYARDKLYEEAANTLRYAPSHVRSYMDYSEKIREYELQANASTSSSSQFQLADFFAQQGNRKATIDHVVAAANAPDSDIYTLENCLQLLINHYNK